MAADLSFIHLITNASVVVQLVMLLLVAPRWCPGP